MLSNYFTLGLTGLLATIPTVLAVPVQERDTQAADPARFKTYNLKTPLLGPCDLEHGPDDALWGQGILVNNFFRIDPTTGDVEEYPIPFTTPLSNQTIELPGIAKSLTDRTALSCAIRKGADGNIYAGNGLRNQLVRINPTTKHIDIFEPTPLNPAGNLFNFNDLYSAKDGIWLTATTGNTFSFFSFATETFTSHTVPTPLALPLGLYVASDGVVYVAELVGNKILTFDPKTQEMHEYPLPEAAQLPAVIRAERDGNIFFSLFPGNGIGRINMATHKIDLFHTNQTLLLGSEDTIDKYGGVWLSSFTTDVMSRLDTNTYEFSYIALPNSLAQTGAPGVFGDVPPYVDIAVNYGPGDAIWYTSLTTNQVGRFDISGLYT